MRRHDHRDVVPKRSRAFRDPWAVPDVRQPSSLDVDPEDLKTRITDDEGRDIPFRVVRRFSRDDPETP